MADNVNHPTHYTSHPSGVECIDIVEQLNFNLGNAFKYVFRYTLKNGVEDLKKAHWYCKRELARVNNLPDVSCASASEARETMSKIFDLVRQEPNQGIAEIYKNLVLCHFRGTTAPQMSEKLHKVIQLIEQCQ